MVMSEFNKNHSEIELYLKAFQKNTIIDYWH